MTKPFIADHALDQVRVRLADPSIDRTWIKANMQPQHFAAIRAGAARVRLDHVGIELRCVDRRITTIVVPDVYKWRALRAAEVTVVS